MKLYEEAAKAQQAEGGANAEGKKRMTTLSMRNTKK